MSDGKPKILFLSPNGVLGGAEQHLLMLIRRLAPHANITIYLFSPLGSSKWLEVGNCNVLKPKNSSLIARILFVAQMFIGRTHRSYDYIYTSHLYTSALVGFLKRIKLISSKYHIVRESTSVFLRFKGLKLRLFESLYKHFYYKVDLLICQSVLMKTQLIENIQKFREISVVIENPVDLFDIRSRENTESIDVPDEFLVAAGRLIEEKGFDILIRAFVRIREHHPNLKLVILGEGREVNNLKSLSGRLDIGSEVIFKGFVSNVLPYFFKAQCCIVSSRIEGFPNVLLQMMSQNGRVVSTLCAGGIETIPNIHTCAVGDVKALSDAILKSLNHSDERFSFERYLSQRDVSNYISQIRKHLNSYSRQ